MLLIIFFLSLPIIAIWLLKCGANSISKDLKNMNNKMQKNTPEHNSLTLFITAIIVIIFYFYFFN